MEITADREDLLPRYIVGIDLGTTNSALAYVERDAKPGQGNIRFFDIPQLTAPFEIGRRPILPSFLYIPGQYDLPPNSVALPWDSDRKYVVGEAARKQGALVPGRLVASAKSWLCHAGVDRTADILPWGAGADVKKMSPVEASSLYLLHLREAWNDVVAQGREEHLLERQTIILTVPASFDEVARELTVAAAAQAGLKHVILLEEPLAAFYSWLSEHEGDWRERVQPGHIILVCDIGGGTTDFTVIAVREGEKGPRFDRLAVGDHLLLGGDNMDLLLARQVEMDLLGKPGSLESGRWLQLLHQCGRAKEILLARDFPSEGASATEGGRNSVDISIVGSGSRLIAGALKTTLTRQKAEDTILEYFFPFVSIDEELHLDARTGITEWGLPYVLDSAVTRRLAEFWRRNVPLLVKETGRDPLFPDYILFNGGTLIPSTIRNRVLAVTRRWFEGMSDGDPRPIELDNPRPELAVAIGAAYYGRVREGEGVRVGAGSPRAYYAQVFAGDAPREARSEGSISAVCLVPRGAEEGFRTELDRPSFEALANQPAVFKIFSSSTRLGDRPGDLVDLSPDEATELPPIRTVLRYGKKSSAQTIPVQLGVRLTEIGTLELWCRSLHTPHRWQLQFDVRRQSEAQAIPGETIDARLIERAQEKVLSVFTRKPKTSPGDPDRLPSDIVSILDIPKEEWPTSTIRKFADTLISCEQGRFLTPRGESRLLNLLGYCLRPGFGDPLDEWRMKEVWKMYPGGPAFPRSAQNRSEWWVFWRRVAGGLSAGQQLRIHQHVAAGIPTEDKKRRKSARRQLKGVGPQEELEILMMLANLERLPVEEKVGLGRILLEKIASGKPKTQELWALARLGARAPLYGPLDRVAPAEEISSWIRKLFSVDLQPSEALARSITTLCRRTGDRVRDLSESDLEKLSDILRRFPGGDRYVESLSDPGGAFLRSERDWVFGESLPAGLIVSSGGPAYTS